MPRSAIRDSQLWLRNVRDSETHTNQCDFSTSSSRAPRRQGEPLGHAGVGGCYVNKYLHFIVGTIEQIWSPSI